MDEPDSMHPAYSTTQFTKEPAEKELPKAGMGVWRRYEIEQLSARDMFKNENMMRHGAEGVYVGYD